MSNTCRYEGYAVRRPWPVVEVGRGQYSPYCRLLPPSHPPGQRSPRPRRDLFYFKLRFASFLTTPISKRRTRCTSFSSSKDERQKGDTLRSTTEKGERWCQEIKKRLRTGHQSSTCVVHILALMPAFFFYSHHLHISPGAHAAGKLTDHSFDRLVGLFCRPFESYFFSGGQWLREKTLVSANATPVHDVGHFN